VTFFDVEILISGFIIEKSRRLIENLRTNPNRYSFIHVGIVDTLDLVLLIIETISCVKEATLLKLWLLGDDVYRSSNSVTPVERALSTPKHLSPINVEEISPSEVPATQKTSAYVDAVAVQANGGLGKSPTTGS